MTVKEAIEAISGAEIASRSTPIRKLQLALVTLISAAKRATIYDNKLADGKMVEIPDCKKCFWEEQIAWHQCEQCLGGAKNNFLAKEEVHHG